MWHFVCTTQGHASQILQNRPCWEDGWRLPCCPETLMTDGLSSGGGAGSRDAGETAGTELQRGPVSSERPCHRGQRTEDLESPETWAGLSHLLDGQSHHPAHPRTHAHTARPALSLAFQPRPVQPDLSPASAPPGSESATHTAFSPFPSRPWPFACALPLPGSPFLLSLFRPCKRGFHISLLSLAAGTVLMPLSRPISSALTGHSPAIVAVVWLLQDRPQEQGVKNSAAASAEEPGSRWTNPSLLAPQRHDFEHDLQFLKGPGRDEPSHPQCNHLLTHLHGLPSLPCASHAS